MKWVGLAFTGKKEKKPHPFQPSDWFPYTRKSMISWRIIILIILIIIIKIINSSTKFE